MPTTQYPVTFEWLQGILNNLGYFFQRLDPDSEKSIIHWKREGHGEASKLLATCAPTILTTLKPDFSADGHTDLVYERDYVVDLLGMLFDGTVSERHMHITEMIAYLNR